MSQQQPDGPRFDHAAFAFILTLTACIPAAALLARITQ